jgi:hypothetical protein
MRIQDLCFAPDEAFELQSVRQGAVVSRAELKRPGIQIEYFELGEADTRIFSPSQVMTWARLEQRVRTGSDT